MEFGATDTSDNSAVIHYLALSHAKQKYLAVDHSKLNNVSFTSVIPLNELDGIILDTEFSPEWKDFLEKTMFVITDHLSLLIIISSTVPKKNRNENPHSGFFVYGYYFLSTYFSTGLIPIFSKDSLNGS